VLGFRAIRRQMVAAFCTFAVVWALWGLDVYMMKLSPHWGQHEIMQAYYADRANAEEILVAYQMNWKGENIYTGNHVPAFVSSGQTFQTWLKGQKDKGVRVMYFVTEHSRTGGLRSEVNAKAYKEITDKALCNKFVWCARALRTALLRAPIEVVEEVRRRREGEHRRDEARRARPHE